MHSSAGRPSAVGRGAPVVIELVGVPGAGKTALADDVIAWLKQRGARAGSIQDLARDHAHRSRAGRLLTTVTPARLHRPLLWWAFYLLGLLHVPAAARERPGLLRHVLATQRRRPLSRALMWHVTFWSFQLIGRHRLVTVTPLEREVLVLDDGFVHRAVALHASHLEEPADDRVRAYVDLLPEPAVLVRVNAAPELCARRVRDRGPWRHRPLGDDELAGYLRNAARVVDVAVDQALRGGWQVIEVDNEDRPLDEVRARLRDSLADLALEPHAPASGGVA